MVGSRRLTDEQRAELLEQAGHTCSACGATLTSLQIAHVVPLALGGSDDLTNLTVLCQACHARLDLHQPRETEFIEFLAHLIERHPAFEHVQQDSPLGRDRRYRADITAVRRISATPEHLVIECKRDSVLSGVRTRNILEQLREYRRHLTHAKLVLAFPGRASDQDMGELSGLVEIWDIDRLSELFRDQLTTVIHPYFTPLFAAAAARIGPQKKLIQELHDCPAGKIHWGEYQRLVGRILEELFCPDLRPPLPEHPDHTKTNRRDFIMPNYSKEGFWYFMRSRYGADYIVVDAKNTKGFVQKKDVLQLANYLKPQGTGSFGMIVCRSGADRGATVTLREQWLLHSKLIIVLTDRDVEAMLLARASAGDPTSVLSDRIQEFRLSI